MVVQRAVFERVFFIARARDVAVGKGVDIEDNRAALRDVLEVHLQRRWVHSHQHVGIVARRLNIVRREIDLERTDTEGGSGRRTYFRREIWEGREIVTH